MNRNNPYTPIPRRPNRKRLGEVRFGGVTYDNPKQMADTLGYSVQTVLKWLRAGYTYLGQVKREQSKHRQRRSSR